MKSLKSGKALFPTTVLMLIALAGFGQTVNGSYGSLSGRVTNPEGVVVPDAMVTVTDSEGVAVTVSSDEDGEFTVGHLVPGVYSVKIVEPRTGVFQQTGIHVAAHDDAGNQSDDDDTSAKIQATLHPAASVASVGSSDEALPRVTGIATLLPTQKEEAGYGLYSYALISAKPSASDLPKVKAYLSALVDLPTAASEEQYISRKRINITYIPLRRLSSGWEDMETDAKVNYVVNNYDYARAAVVLASLNTRMGAGPVIISLLTPLNVSQHPHPVLVVDLTTAQPKLVQSYVTYFKEQAGKSQFWQERTLSHFSVSMRNFLENAATGLGMSKDAVNSLIKIL